MRMKVISLWQPWATLVALALKRNETRSWATDYRGPLAIQAAKRKTADQREYMGQLLADPRFRPTLHRHGYCTFDDLPFGAVVCAGMLVGCRPTEECTDLTDIERLVGGYGPGRFAWALHNVERLIEPVPLVGRQGFFWWDRDA